MNSGVELKKAKKPRKEARPPQQISEETWRSIEMALVAGGLGFSEVGRRFGVSPHAVMMRAKRHGWAVPSRIAERTAALQARSKACESDRNGNDQVVQAVAASWAEKGEQHRALAFDLANSELRRAAKAGLPVKSWRDASLADSVARKAAGLDHEETSRISVAMELINVRLEKNLMEMPKDLPEDDPSSFEYGPPAKQL